MTEKRNREKKLVVDKPLLVWNRYGQRRTAFLPADEILNSKQTLKPPSIKKDFITKLKNPYKKPNLEKEPSLKVLLTPAERQALLEPFKKRRPEKK